MDDIKDIRKEHMSRVLANRTSHVRPFGVNISAERAYRRAERISAAVYLATNHIAEGEPAVLSARKIVLEILSAILGLSQEMRNVESAGYRKTHMRIRELVSAIRLLAVAGHISPHNAEALVEALDELGNFLAASQKTALSESVSFDKADFFDTGQQAAPRLLSDKQRRTGSRKAIKDKKDIRERTPDRAVVPRRSDRILTILGNQGQLGIKDIAASLPEYSEKMIQRELKMLVGQGRVKKQGSKRWSTYARA